MSYTPTLWKENDLITADKLNNLEDGSYNAHKHILNLGKIPAQITSTNIGNNSVISISFNAKDIDVTDNFGK